jgi:hypothetical protein
MMVRSDSIYVFPANFQGDVMKLPLISATILAYTLLAAAWISYSQLVALY